MPGFRDVMPRGVVVSCQAPPGDPLHGSDVMALMAVAVAQGGAVGIRADGASDIAAIRARVRLPIIGIAKRRYPRSPVSITPTFEEAREVAAAGADAVGLDGTARRRPGDLPLTALVERIHAELGLPVLADVSTLEEGRAAAAAGADAVASTLSGYVSVGDLRDAGPPGTAAEPPGPDLDLVRALARELSIPIFAEGRYHAPADAARAIEAGAYAVVVGAAITRPHVITGLFAGAVARRIAAL